MMRATNCGTRRAMKSTPVVTGLTPLTAWNQNERKKGILVQSASCPCAERRDERMQVTHSVSLGS